MVAERRPFTDYAPSRIGNEVSTRVQSIISSVLEKADIEERRQLTTGISGEVDLYGQTVPYNLRASSKDGSMVATLRLTDEKERSAKVSKIEFIVTPHTKLVRPEGSWLRRVFSTGEYAFAIETNFDRGTVLSYESGRKTDNLIDNVMSPDIPNTPLTHMTREFFGVTVDPAVDSSIVLINEAGRPAISRIRQRSYITNPGLAYPHLMGQIEGAMTKTGDFIFVMGAIAIDQLGEDDVAAFAYRRYLPTTTKSGVVYQGETIGLEVISPLPDPVRVTPPSDEVALTDRGRKNAGRIEVRLPRRFSVEQVSQMLANLLEGRVFTAGVWNPLEVTGSRRASKPLKK